MPDENRDRRDARPEDAPDPEFQRKWLEARDLSMETVEQAFRHGLDSRDRFAERPFDEVEDYLRQSWDGMGAPAPWQNICDIVRSGYEHYKGAGFGIVDLGPEARGRFPDRTNAGSTTGGVLGERFFLGGAEPVSDYEGEDGPPVEGGRRVKE